MAFQGDSIYWVEVEKIVPNPYQPRRDFDEGKLKELAESVRMYGVLQPLTVTRKEVSNEDGTFYAEYELIAGERRLRASKLAQLPQVPVIIRTGEQSDQEKLELAIIENLQREDLNAVDRAIAFRQLADQFNMSHAAVAKKVGRSREYVSNSLRLLNLPEYMLTSLKQGDISEGHGRTLLMLTDRPEEQDTVFREILLKKLSVREVERIARKIATDKVRKKDWGMDPVLMEIEKRFTDTLGTRVQIQKTDYGGKLTIDYFTNDDLEKLLHIIDQAESPTQMQNDAVAALAALTHSTGVEQKSDDTWVEKVTSADFQMDAPEQSPWPLVQSADESEAMQSEAVTIHHYAHYTTPHDQHQPVQERELPNQAESALPFMNEQNISVNKTPDITASTYQTQSTQPPHQNQPPAAPQPEQTIIYSAYTTPTRSPFPTATPEAQSHHNSVFQQPAAVPKPSEDEDDTDLYAMRNFSV